MRKYERKWPNCANIKCFTNVDLEVAKSFCIAQADCDGFSISASAMGGGHGDGCYKTKCEDDGWNGYETGSDGYWAKVRVWKGSDPTKERALDAFLQKLMPHATLENGARDQHCNSQGLCMVRKYQKKWPNCNNLRCFERLTLEDAHSVCLSHPACNGFTISSGTSNKERGSGCYKTTCKDEGWNGYESGQDDYWTKT